MAVELATVYIPVVPSFGGAEQVIRKQGQAMGQQLGDDMGGALSKSTSSRSGGIGGALGGINKGFAALGGFAVAGIGISVVTDAISGFVSAAEESEKVTKQTNAVIKSTGGVANVTAQGLDTLVTALSAKAGIDDELIASGANVLLTFTKVRNEVGAGNNIFDQATAAALDMSAALGQDFQGSVTMLGKALNDPIKGIQAMSRAGVQFTAEQKEQIKTLVESGDVMGAQKVILGEMETQFGGMAESSATASGKLGVAWGNIQEKLGEKLLPMFEKFANWLIEVLPGAIATAEEWFNKFQPVFQAVGFYLETLWTVWSTIWTTVWKLIIEVIQGVIGVIETGVAGVLVAWEGIQAVWTFLDSNVIQPVRGAVDAVVGWLQDRFGEAVAVAVAAWQPIDAIFTWLRDNVFTPVMDKVGEIRDTIGGVFSAAVTAATTAWSGIKAVYDWFVDNVYLPVREKIGALRDFIGEAFGRAVDAVGAIWSGLKRVVAAPINVVLGFYNNGIRKVWNWVAEKVGLPTLSEIAPLEFATGGYVPGTGNRDTVQAMLTPGEFVINPKSAEKYGPLLELMNDPRAKLTLDPGIFGYAAGGYVRSAEEVRDWGLQQVGKRYQYPMVGPAEYDCSGLTSALINYALGLYPHSRRHSSSSISGDPAVRAGRGTPETGMSFGAKSAYTTNQQGASVGHIAATVAGTNIEATPPAVRAGGGARGVDTAMFTSQWHLPDFGGMSKADQETATNLMSLLQMRIPDLGGGAFGDMLESLFGRLPKIIFDFLVQKMPKMIAEAAFGIAAPGVPGGIGTLLVGAKALVDALPFGSGGTVPRDGPIVVGDRGVPELMWANRGAYIEDNVRDFADRRSGRGGIRDVIINHHGETVTPDTISRGIRKARVS